MREPAGSRCSIRASTSLLYTRRTSVSNPPAIDDPAIPLPQDDLPASSVAPTAIDEVPSAAIHSANIPEAAIPELTFTLPATDAATIADAGADIDVDGDGARRCRRYARCDHDKERDDRNDEYSQAHARYLSAALKPYGSNG